MESIEYIQCLSLVKRIRECSQSRFTNQLKIKYDVPDDFEEWLPGLPAHQPFFRIAEVYKTYWFIIPRKRYKNLFVINPGFSGGAYRKKEINCVIFNQLISDIVDSELKAYANTFQATGINLTQRFPS